MYWLQEEYPAIQKKAKTAKATICSGDDAEVCSDYHSGTTWTPKGQTLVVRTTGARHSLNLVSAVSAKGFMRFMTVRGKLTAERFIEFLGRLLKKPKHRYRGVEKNNWCFKLTAAACNLVRMRNLNVGAR